MEIFIQAKDYYSQLAQIYTVCDTQSAICQADKPHVLTNVKFMLYSDIFYHVWLFGWIFTPFALKYPRYSPIRNPH